MKIRDSHFWAWLTGFYEGEGCPSYNLSGKRGKQKYLRIIIIQKDRRPLDYIKKRTKDFNTKVYPRRSKKKITSWMLCCAAPHSYRFASMMLPHMRHDGKIEQIKRTLREYQY